MTFICSSSSSARLLGWCTHMLFSSSSFTRVRRSKMIMIPRREGRRSCTWLDSKQLLAEERIRTKRSLSLPFQCCPRMSKQTSKRRSLYRIRAFLAPLSISCLIGKKLTKRDFCDGRRRRRPLMSKQASKQAGTVSLLTSADGTERMIGRPQKASAPPREMSLAERRHAHAHTSLNVTDGRKWKFARDAFAHCNNAWPQFQC